MKSQSLPPLAKVLRSRSGLDDDFDPHSRMVHSTQSKKHNSLKKVIDEINEQNMGTTSNYSHNLERVNIRHNDPSKIII